MHGMRWMLLFCERHAANADMSHLSLDLPTGVAQHQMAAPPKVVCPMRRAPTACHATTRSR